MKKKAKETTCPDCGGTKLIGDQPCETCGGEGTVQMAEEKRSLPYFKRLHALLKEMFKDQVTEAEFMGMTRKARAHAGGVASAKKRSQSQMSEQFISSLNFAEHTGLTVGFWLDEPSAQALVISGGESADGLHLTLCYCADIALLGEVAVARAIVAIESVASYHPALMGKTGGLGRFNASPTSDGKDVVYASIDMPGLSEFRSRVAEALGEAGCAPRTDHGFTPHITLGYIDSGAALPVGSLPAVNLRFATISISVGDKRIDIPMRDSSSAVRVAGEASYGDMQREIEAAFLQRFNSNTSGGFKYWMRDVYPSGSLIACDNQTQKLYRVPFMRTGDGYQFGQFEEVEEAREYLPVELAELCAQGSGRMRLFVELSKYAEPPEWIPYLPKPGEFKHEEYGVIKMTKERNRHFIQNFKDKVYQSRLPINAEHKPNEDGAYGWITDMRLNNDESVDARVKWTDLGEAAIRNDRFHYISPEWFDEWERKSTRETFKDVASGAALTVRPFFKEDSLRPLVATEAGLLELSSGYLAPAQAARVFRDQDVTYIFTALEPIQSMEVPTMAEEKPAQVAKGMSEDETKRFVEMETKMAAQATELAALKTASEAKDTELRTASERVVALEKTARAQRFNETVKTFSGKRDEHLKFMEGIAEKFGEESEMFTQYVARERAVAEQLRQSDGSGDAQTPLEKLAAEAVKIKAAEPLLSEAVAFSKACDLNPATYNEHVAATRTGAS